MQRVRRGVEEVLAKRAAPIRALFAASREAWQRRHVGRGRSFDALWLSLSYAVVVVFSWPILAMVALGIADAIFGLRLRYLRGRPPPLPAS